MSENLTQQLPEDLLRLLLARLDSIDARMTSIEQRMTTLEQRMDALEEKVDRRLQETRPIWEAVLKRLDAVEARMACLESEVRVGVRQYRPAGRDTGGGRAGTSWA